MDSRWIDGDKGQTHSLLALDEAGARSAYSNEVEAITFTYGVSAKIRSLSRQASQKRK